jgi:hypothetical protein
MIALRPLLTVVALALASSTALAFQEQQAAVPATKAAAAVVSSPDVSASAAPEAAGTKGTAVRIPGLGTLGVIPKMDFGLELLYGVADASNPAKRPDIKNGDGEDVLIRGSIKHKF